MKTTAIIIVVIALVLAGIIQLSLLQHSIEESYASYSPIQNFCARYGLYGKEGKCVESLIGGTIVVSYGMATQSVIERPNQEYEVVQDSKGNFRFTNPNATRMIEERKQRVNKTKQKEQ